MLTTRRQVSTEAYEFLITTEDASAAALTKVLPLFTLNPRQTVIGVKVIVDEAFAGPSITDVKMTIGKSGAAAEHQASFDVDILGVAESVSMKGAEDVAEVVNATFTATGANLSVATAGIIRVVVYYFQDLTPA